MTSASANRCSSMSELYSSTSAASRWSTSILRPRSLSIFSSIMAFWRSSSSSFRRLPEISSISERVRCTRRPSSFRVASGRAVSAATASAVLSRSSIASRGFFSANRFASSCCAATCAESFAAMTSIGKDSGVGRTLVDAVFSTVFSGCASAASIGVVEANAMMNTAAKFCFGVIRVKVNFLSEPRAKAMP